MVPGKSILLSIAYAGPASYFAALAAADEIWIEAHENYSKQTYRNRCRIITANGVLNLTIPVIKVNGNHTKIKDIEISYHTKWQQLQWRAITAAYNHSPFFLYYQDALEPFYQRKFISLLDFNLQLTNTVLNLAGIQKEIRLTDEYEKSSASGILDLRNNFSPKKPQKKSLPGYIQVFEERHDFVSDLSILDVLLNLGPETAAYLNKITNN